MMLHDFAVETRPWKEVIFILNFSPIWIFFYIMQVAGHWCILHDSYDLNGHPATCIHRENVQKGLESAITAVCHSAKYHAGCTCKLI